VYVIDPVQEPPSSRNKAYSVPIILRKKKRVQVVGKKEIHMELVTVKGAVYEFVSTVQALVDTRVAPLPAGMSTALQMLSPGHATVDGMNVGSPVGTGALVGNKVGGGGVGSNVGYFDGTGSAVGSEVPSPTPCTVTKANPDDEAVLIFTTEMVISSPLPS